MRSNYVLIDYENVQPDSLDVLNNEHFKLLVFVGASQTKVRFDVASALQRMHERAEYIRISGNGSNALDFHIAFHIGELSVRDPGGCFHIVSKDTGFDPLIQHLKERNILATRVKEVVDIQHFKTVKAETIGQKLEQVVADLKRRGASKPRTVKTLTSTVAAIFNKKLSIDEVEALVKQLGAKGWVTVEGTKVSYSLPG